MGAANGTGQIVDTIIKRAPSAKPSFTVKDLRDAIPEHCFQRSLLRSIAYLVVDLLVAFALFSLTPHFDNPSIPYQPISSVLLWILYVAVQGCVCTGLWVIAHECGHGAFSDYGVINDTVGLLLHSALLVPYFSWKYSHRRHHSNTGNLEKDEVFVPKREEALTWRDEVQQQPLGRVVYLAAKLTLGWPMYLAFNATGRPYDGWANHFMPSSPIFNKRERVWVLISDLGLLAVLCGLYWISTLVGASFLLMVYILPLLVVNMFLVLITFLQHTHLSLPHYTGTEWDWLRGALATVDRDYGVLNTVFHHIADTHVAHHLFSTMPHYHAQEATSAIKKVLGSYYQSDNTPIVSALWRELRECIYVAPDKEGANGVLWFHKKTKSA